MMYLCFINRRTIAAFLSGMACMFLGFIPSEAWANDDKNVIEVSGVATIHIIPDRLTVEIGMEEYYTPDGSGDSVVVRLPLIEKRVRKVLGAAGVRDSLIVVSDLGNYRNRQVSDKFLMTKKLSVILSDFGQAEYISEHLDRSGISSYNITGIDNSDISRYNRQGLKAALKAAREKAEFIAANEDLKIVGPCEIIEDGPVYYETPTFGNVAFERGSGMESMRRIVRRYSVKVKYMFIFE